VIDYEGKKLRHTTVEFEVTKEPAGTRVYYHSPEQITKGTIMRMSSQWQGQGQADNS
jgi:hypothetical protein